MALSYTEAQIQAKLDSISSIADDVETNANDIDTLETTVDGLSTTVGEHTTTLGTLSTKVDETFLSVSNGKSLVASAITDKGVTTASDATFQTMANNIANIATGGSGIYRGITTTSTTTTTISTSKSYYILAFMFRSTSYYAMGVWSLINGTLSQVRLYQSNGYSTYITPSVSGKTLTIPRAYNSTYPTYFLLAEV